MKHIFPFICALLSLISLAACHSGNDGEKEGRAYNISATFTVDSTVVLDHMVLYTDNHAGLNVDTIILTPDHKLRHEGKTSGLDELYLCADGGELCRFYASGGMEVDMSLKSEGDNLAVSFAESANDTINAWLQEHVRYFAGIPKAKQKGQAIDSLCHAYPADVRNTLLLREVAIDLQDSILVRQCLGALTDEAKPNWLIKSIDRELDENASYLKRYTRLVPCKFTANDSIEYDLRNSRSDYLLIYFWADYSQASVDSLRILDNLVNKEYEMKRLKLMTCCVNAPDSAWWHMKTQGIEGLHVLLPAGFSDKRIYDWHVSSVPGVLLCDMYNNLQQRNVWGSTLRDALNRVPNQSGFAHTPQIQPNGRPNNLRRPSGH